MFNFFVRATALREQFCKEEFGDLKIKVLTQIVSAVFMRGSEEIKFFTIYLPISEIPSEHFSLHKVSKEILGNLGIDLTDFSLTGETGKNIPYLCSTIDYIYVEFKKLSS